MHGSLIKRAVEKWGSYLKTEKPEANAAEVCFLMDCTGSMGSWIDVRARSKIGLYNTFLHSIDGLADRRQICKKEICNITDAVKSAFPNITLRLSFVGYRDIRDSPRFSVSYSIIYSPCQISQTLSDEVVACFLLISRSTSGPRTRRS